MSGYSVIVSEKPNSSSGSALDGTGVSFTKAAFNGSLWTDRIVTVAFDESPVTISPASNSLFNPVATNLLLLDETFDSSLDHDGVENLLKILNTLGEDTNTFIISHKGDILDGKFESKIEFVKERNFSQMKI